MSETLSGKTMSSREANRVTKLFPFVKMAENMKVYPYNLSVSKQIGKTNLQNLFNSHLDLHK